MSAVRDTIRTFISKNFYVSAEGLTDVESLLDRGVVDSTAILEVISFLEETFSIRVDDAEILPENLDSIAAITRFVEGKQSA
jgi:acyl carrier protein